jgi:archaellum component FlaC
MMTIEEAIVRVRAFVDGAAIAAYPTTEKAARLILDEVERLRAEIAAIEALRDEVSMENSELRSDLDRALATNAEHLRDLVAAEARVKEMECALREIAQTNDIPEDSWRRSVARAALEPKP